MQTTMPKRAVSLMAAATLALAVLVGAPTAARADGTTWTLQTTPDGTWTSVAYGNGLWVAVANDGNNRVMTSPDGITWTARQVPQAAQNASWVSVAFGNGYWVAVSVFGGGVMRSPDGINWTHHNVDNVALNADWNSVAYGTTGGQGRWVAVGSSPPYVMTSDDDGATWAPRPAVQSAGEVFPGGPETGWSSVAYGNGYWVAVANITGAVMRSQDGIAWTTITGAPSREWTSVAYGDGLWVAVASGGAGNRVMTSADSGAGWASWPAAANLLWRSVAYGEGVWVAVSSSGSGNRVMTGSLDGSTWTSRTSAADYPWRGVAYGGGAWVAVSSDGSGGRVMTSGATAATSVSQAAPTPPSLSCTPTPFVVGAPVTCSVTGGDPGIDILWRAAHAQPFAARGVTLDDAGTGEFTFVVPAVARGQELTVELVEWLAPLSLGVAGGPVPTSVPSGEGPAVPGWLVALGLLAAAGAVAAARRGQVVAD